METNRVNIPWVFYFLISVLIILVHGCSPKYFGLSEEQWNATTPQERQQIIEAYNERKKLYAQRSLEREKRLRAEAEQRRLLTENTVRKRRAKVEQIYAGVSGQLGDLIRVTLKNGKMEFGFKYRSYRAVSFKIADGEFRKIVVQHDWKKRELGVFYLGGTLLLDVVSPNDTSGAAAVPFSPSWERGSTVSVSSQGPLELRNVSVTVSIIYHRKDFWNKH
ncbi:MAG: hypothetical protein K9J81_09365 [Desulfohalobiaceae bacterium]|nr:hypothetical protein [Desulfohalobiaceae bacterium]